MNYTTAVTASIVHRTNEHYSCVTHVCTAIVYYICVIHMYALHCNGILLQLCHTHIHCNTTSVIHILTSMIHYYICVIHVYTSMIYYFWPITAAESSDNSTVSINILHLASSAAWHKPVDTWQSRHRVEWEGRHQWWTAADAAEWNIVIFTTATVSFAHFPAAASRVHSRSVGQPFRDALRLNSSIQLLQPVSLVKFIVSHQSVRVTRIHPWRHTERVVTCHSAVNITIDQYIIN